MKQNETALFSYYFTHLITVLCNQSVTQLTHDYFSLSFTAAVAGSDKTAKKSVNIGTVQEKYPNCSVHMFRFVASVFFWFWTCASSNARSH